MYFTNDFHIDRHMEQEALHEEMWERFTEDFPDWEEGLDPERFVSEADMFWAEVATMR